jgi:hypothetical protein
MVLTPTLQMGRAELKARARAEFLEMPGLSLTLAQASRLCGACPDDCLSVFDELVLDGFLRRDGSVYLRADTGRRCA